MLTAPRLTYQQAFDYLVKAIGEADKVPAQEVQRYTYVSHAAMRHFNVMLTTRISPQPSSRGLVWTAISTVDDLIRQLPLEDVRQ